MRLEGSPHNTTFTPGLVPGVQRLKTLMSIQPPKSNPTHLTVVNRQPLKLIIMIDQLQTDFP